MTSELLDLDAAGVLARQEVLVVEQRAREVEELELTLRWADLHGEDPRDRSRPLMPGDDHLVSLGGEGTPEVQELCWAEYAIARGAGVIATQNLAADALDLAYRLPLLWEAVRDLALPGWVARKVASMSRRLSAVQVELVDAAVAAAVNESPSRILRIAEAKVIEADVEGHRARLVEEASKVGVRLSQPRPGDALAEAEGVAGTRRLHLRLNAGAAVELDATIDEIADALMDQIIAETGSCERPRGELEAMAVELLTDPHAAARFLDGLTDPRPASLEPDDYLPTGEAADAENPADAEGPAPDSPPVPVPVKKRPATIYVHTTPEVLTGLVPGVVRVEGMGPMLPEQLAELLKNREITIAPVIDLRENRSVNAYEFPTTIKQRTLLRMLGDVFPASTNAAYRRLDHDHATPYLPPSRGGPPGQTGDHNDAPLTRKHHRAKTHAGYELTQLGLGTYRWITPHGLGRLVTRTGTRAFTPLRNSHGESIGELYFADLLGSVEG